MKIHLFKFSFILILILTLIFILSILNYFFSSAPRYKELVFDLEKGTLKEKKEKLVFYKSNYFTKNDKFIKINSAQYQNYNYSGKLVNRRCGSVESGISELYFISDKYGFRENKDSLYKNTDIILLGDSFTESICVNKPFDLKSNLKKINKKLNYLNLGRQGTDYPQQLYILLKLTADTNFDSLVWFFYEGNDYEGDSNKFNKLSFNKTLETPENLNREININDINYNIKKKINISYTYKLKVFIAEYLSGLGFFVKFFLIYDDLLKYEDYENTLKSAKMFLDSKNIKKKYIYYIPSWQRLTNYKSKESVFYKFNPQIKQLDKLKNSVKEISLKNGFTFIDGEKFFMNLNNPLQVYNYELNTHFNEIGYEYLAMDVLNNINTQE